MPQIVVIEGPETGMAFDLGSVAFIGRSADCDVTLTDPAVYDRHLKFTAHKDAWAVAVVGAVPCVVINGQEESRAWLHHGDLIELGESVLLFSQDEAIEVPDKFSDTEVQRMMATTQVRRKYDTGSMQLLDLMRTERTPRKKLVGLMRLSETLGAFDDRPHLLESVLDILFETFPADRGAVLLHDEGTTKFHIAAHRMRGKEGAGGKGTISRSILREVFRTRESLLLVDAQSDQRFDQRRSIAEQKIRSVMCVPLQAGERFLGMLSLDSVSRKGVFSEEDLEILSAMGYQSAVALENVRLAVELREKARLEHELDLAGLIQRRVLPEGLPHRDDLDIFGIMVPAREVGGDYYDFLEIRDDLYLAIGDVSGKGVNAGLITMMARSYLRPLLKALAPPCQIMAELNDYLVQDTMPGMFMSFLLLRWQADDATFRFCGAGHEHILIWRRATGEVEAIRSGGLALGVSAKGREQYADRDLPFHPGDVLLLYTDGVTEAMNLEGDFFGLEGLTAALSEHASAAPEDLVGAIVKDVRQFVGRARQHDDITLVCARLK